LEFLESLKELIKNVTNKVGNNIKTITLVFKGDGFVIVLRDFLNFIGALTNWACTLYVCIAPYFGNNE